MKSHVIPPHYSVNPEDQDSLPSPEHHLGATGQHPTVPLGSGESDKLSSQDSAQEKISQALPKPEPEDTLPDHMDKNR